MGEAASWGVCGAVLSSASGGGARPGIRKVLEPSPRGGCGSLSPPAGDSGRWPSANDAKRGGSPVFVRSRRVGGGADAGMGRDDPTILRGGGGGGADRLECGATVPAGGVGGTLAFFGGGGRPEPAGGSVRRAPVPRGAVMSGCDSWAFGAPCRARPGAVGSGLPAGARCAAPPPRSCSESGGRTRVVESSEVSPHSASISALVVDRILGGGPSASPRGNRGAGGIAGSPAPGRGVKRGTWVMTARPRPGLSPALGTTIGAPAADETLPSPAGTEMPASVCISLRGLPAASTRCSSSPDMATSSEKLDAGPRASVPTF